MSEVTTNVDTITDYSESRRFTKTNVDNPDWEARQAKADQLGQTVLRAAGLYSQGITKVEVVEGTTDEVGVPLIKKYLVVRVEYIQRLDGSAII